MRGVDVGGLWLGGLITHDCIPGSPPGLGSHSVSVSAEWQCNMNLVNLFLTLNVQSIIIFTVKSIYYTIYLF